jgi:hypothetical protein
MSNRNYLCTVIALVSALGGATASRAQTNDSREDPCEKLFLPVEKLGQILDKNGEVHFSDLAAGLSTIDTQQGRACDDGSNAEIATETTTRVLSEVIRKGDERQISSQGALDELVVQHIDPSADPNAVQTISKLDCLASTTFSGQRQLFFPIDDNYKLLRMPDPRLD